MLSSFDDVYGKAKNMSSLDVELDAGEENLGDDILSLSTADEIQVSLTQGKTH